jgi:hypothetical protein
MREKMGDMGKVFFWACAPLVALHACGALTLFDFETDEERADVRRWNGGDARKVCVTNRMAGSGANALRATNMGDVEDAKIGFPPHILLRPKTTDWRGYDRMVMDVVSARDSGANGVMRLFLCGPTGGYDRGIWLHLPLVECGYRQWVVPLKPSKRLGDIARLYFAFESFQNGCDVYIDRIALLKKGEDLPVPSSPCIGREVLPLVMAAKDTLSATNSALAAELGHLRAYVGFCSDAAKSAFRSPQMAIGTATSMEKVRPRADIAARAIPKEGLSVRLARNEYESVQVVVASTGGDLKGVKVSVAGDLRGEGGVFAATNISCDVVGFVSARLPPYYNVGYTASAQNGPGYKRMTRKPKEGWWPDPILGFMDGVDVKGTDVQSFFVRVRCPNDQAAGTYRGELAVSAAGVETVRIPFAVRVNGFALGVKSELPLMMTFSPSPEANWKVAKMPGAPMNVWKRHKTEWVDFLADYLVSYDNIYGGGGVDFDALERLRSQGRLGLFNIAYMTRPDSTNAEAVAVWRKKNASKFERMRNVYDEAKRRGILDRAYIYGWDEMPENTFHSVRFSVEEIKRMFPGVPIATTAHDLSYGIKSPLSNMDWFIPNLWEHFPARAAESRKAGHKVWWYICNGPRAPYPNWFIECQAIEARLIMGAMAQRVRPDGFLYFQMSIWGGERCIETGPFVDWPVAFGNFNGDGNMTYVGPDGTPLPSIRLENFRDGLEDYAYAKILERKLEKTGWAASESAADAQKRVPPEWVKRARELLAVPRSVMDTTTNYNDDPAVLYRWRDAMADLIEGSAAACAASAEAHIIPLPKGGISTKIENARLAVQDLVETFGKDYPDGPAHLAELDRFAADPSNAPSARIDAILLENPLVARAKILAVRGNFPLNSNFSGPALYLPRPSKGRIAVIDVAAEKGARVKDVMPNGKDGVVASLDLHWDGDRVLYGDGGALFEFRLSDSNHAARAVTRRPHPRIRHWDGAYLPNGRICCVCNSGWQTVPCTGTPDVGNLHLLDADGSNERRICFDQDHNWTPVPMNDGRVMFSRWEYEDTPHMFTGLLMKMNPDGTQQMELYGSNSYWPNRLLWARPIPGDANRFVAVVSGHHGVGRRGKIVLLDVRKGRFETSGVVQYIPQKNRKIEATILDELVNWDYPHYVAPWPLADEANGNRGAGKFFLASRLRRASHLEKAGKQLWDLVLVDVFGNETILVSAEEAGNGDTGKRNEGWMFARVAAKRPMPRIIPDMVDLSRKDAVIYLADIYRGDGLKNCPRGTVKALRLGTYNYRFWGNALTYCCAVAGGWDVKRILGTVPVEPDGTAMFRVPANTPIFVQPLDAEGKALQLMRSWYNPMPGEVGSCAGCHESQSSTPPVGSSMAAKRPPSVIAPWQGPVRGFDFEHEIQPILSRRCVGCHGEDAAQKGREDFRDKRLRPPEKVTDCNHFEWGWLRYSPHVRNVGKKLKDGFSPSYGRLIKYVRRAGLESDYHLAKPTEFTADTSILVQMLKSGHPSKGPTVELTPEEWEALYAWIDFNVPYYGRWTDSPCPPLSTNLTLRATFLKHYAGLEFHDEDPIPEIPIPKFVPPAGRRPAVPAHLVCAAAAVKGGAVPRRIFGGITFRRVPAPPDGKAFWICETEVSNAQFAKFDPKHDSGYICEKLFKDRKTRGARLNRLDQPVCRVTWDEAKAFCDWFGKNVGRPCRLPTEAEWVWAFADAGPGNDSANIMGLEFKEDILKINWARGRFDADHKDPYRFSAPVGWGAPNALCLRGMCGNVAEWTSTDFAPGVKIVKGGSWADTARYATPSWRWRYEAWRPVYNVGFRMVLDDGPVLQQPTRSRQPHTEPLAVSLPVTVVTAKRAAAPTALERQIADGGQGLAALPQGRFGGSGGRLALPQRQYGERASRAFY